MGRGRKYYGWRKLGEALEAGFYGNGWAARLAYLLGLQGALHIDQHEIALPCVMPAALRLAFVSDLHVGPLTDTRLLDTLFDAIAAFDPQILLLGGDYASLHHRHVEQLSVRLARLKIACGIYGVMGNHDLWLDNAAIEQALRHVGVRLLENEALALPAPYQAISLCGLDEPSVGVPDVAATFRAAGPCRILLMHSPLGLQLLDGQHFDLAFCGHTHGGQIAWPWQRPIILPPGSGERRYSNGYFSFAHGGKLIASRGIGMSDLPIRLFAPSEVHFCTITGQGSETEPRISINQ